MNIIRNNPFRVLGIPIDASERIISRRVSDLKIHLSIGKAMTFDCDEWLVFPLKRTVASVRDAARKIERPESRLFQALFWYWNRSDRDADALRALSNNHPEIASKIWESEATMSGEAERNLSGLRNLSILYLLSSMNGNRFIPHHFERGCILSGKSVQDDRFAEFSAVVLGKTPLRVIESVPISHADVLLRFGESKGLFSGKAGAEKAIRLFESFPERVRTVIMEKLMADQVRFIEEHIEKTREKRMKCPENAALLGKELFRDVMVELETIRFRIHPANIRYRMLADRLASEILQCAVDFFNVSIQKKKERVSAMQARVLLKCAASVASGERIRSRITRNAEVIGKWMDVTSEIKKD